MRRSIRGGDHLAQRCICRASRVQAARRINARGRQRSARCSIGPSRHASRCSHRTTVTDGHRDLSQGGLPCKMDAWSVQLDPAVHDVSGRRSYRSTNTRSAIPRNGPVQVAGSIYASHPTQRSATLSPLAGPDTGSTVRTPCCCHRHLAPEARSHADPHSRSLTTLQHRLVGNQRTIPERT